MKIKFRILNILLFVMLLIVGLNVNLKADIKVASAFDGAAEFYVESTVEDKMLDFGVRYHHDQGYSRINNASYSVAGACEAGGSSYSSKALELKKYYTQNINVLEIPNDTGVNVVCYANIKLGAWTLTSVKSFIQKYEETHPDEKVIAAINGDFFDINSNSNYPRTSTGGTVSNGNYYKVNASWKSIGFKTDENGILSMKGNIMPTISTKPIMEILDDNNNVTYSIDVDKINEKASENEVSVYFTFYNELHQAISEDVENAILVSGSEIAPFSKNSIYGLGEVKNTAFTGSITNYQFAICTSNTEVLNKIKEGSKIRVQYYYTGDLEGYDNVTGYPHNLLVNNVDELGNTDLYRHPRTMIGTREDGTIVMTTVDGRRVASGYYGLNPAEQTALMKYYGCTDAYNLDGGGSTTMVILENGEFVIKNEPSDNSPRSDGNCLLLTVKVPQIEISFNNVTKTAITCKLDVIKSIDKYQDLYLELNGEMKKLENKQATFTNLQRNTEYIYKIYAKVNDKYLGLPLTGSISTSKEKLKIEKVNVSRGIVKEEESYIFEFVIDDPDRTFVNMILDVNGKKYYVRDNTFTVPCDQFSNLNTYLIFTYDLNDANGRIIENLYDFNANFCDATMALDSLSNDVGAWFNALINN